VSKGLAQMSREVTLNVGSQRAFFDLVSKKKQQCIVDCFLQRDWNSPNELRSETTAH
jgi:hypothetical protein